MIWGWVNEDRIYIFGWNVPLKFPVIHFPIDFLASKPFAPTSQKLLFCCTCWFWTQPRTFTPLHFVWCNDTREPVLTPLLFSDSKWERSHIVLADQKKKKKRSIFLLQDWHCFETKWQDESSCNISDNIPSVDLRYLTLSMINEHWNHIWIAFMLTVKNTFACKLLHSSLSFFARFC